MEMIQKNGKFIIIGSFALRIKDVQTVIVDRNMTVKITMRGSDQVYLTPCDNEETASAYVQKILYLLNED